ncbi:MAG TPA: MaoC family dehydratase [Chitinophagaceae bacterium]|nr:MaoC family dehydratase [Chitinophagaceae bacterium]
MEYSVGNKAINYKTYTNSAVNNFAKVAEDKNPIHLDFEYAVNTIFEKPVVHGMLAASQISNLIANSLPSPESIYKSQSLIFKRPIFYNDKIKCKVEIISIVEEKKTIELKTICTNEDNEVVIEGIAVIKLL